MSSPVYVGFWRHLDPEEKGTGWTLTVPTTTGVVIMSTTTLLISVAGGYLWRIAAFALHQVRSDSQPRDGLYHFIQALLANALSSATTAWTLILLGWKWQSSARESPWRLENLVVFGASILIPFAFIFMGISISYWLKKDDLVLGTGENCGHLNDANLAAEGFSAIDSVAIVSAWASRIAYESLDYAQRCYARTRPENGACSSFQMPALTAQNKTVPCPFDERICGLEEAFQVDSGLLHSDVHLGLNLPEEHRMSIRKVLTCVPTLAEDNFSTDWLEEDPFNGTSSLAKPGDTYKYYNLGPSNGGNFTTYLSNYTDALSQTVYYLTNRRWRSNGPEDNYDVAPDPLLSSSFVPIPELHVPQSDITLLFLHRKVGYAQPVKDAWFEATVPATSSDIGPDGPVSFPVYLPNRDLSVLACTEQYQFCTPSEGCTDLAGIDPVAPNFGLQRLDDTQAALMPLLTQALANTTIAIGAEFFGDAFLLAKDSLWAGGPAGVSASLPGDHWKREVDFFMAVVMAAIQRIVVDYANPLNLPVGLSNGTLAFTTAGFDRPENRKPAEQRICQSIRVRSADHLNFNALALLLVVVISFLIIGGHFFLVPGVVFWTRHRMRKGGPHSGADLATQEWVRGGLFRVLARLWEVQGLGSFPVREVGDWDPIPRAEERGSKFEASKFWGFEDAKDGVRYEAVSVSSSDEMQRVYKAR